MLQMSAFVFPTLPWTGDRARVNLSFANVLGGLDALLHGRTHLQGWGMNLLPDQTLLRVRGFDANANSFLYSVNPRFGSTSLATTAQRVPFRITLDVSVEVGHSPAAQMQQLDLNIRLRPALVGTHGHPRISIKRRYMKRSSADGYFDLYGFLLTPRMRDSLALSIDQMRQIQDEREALTQQRRHDLPQFSRPAWRRSPISMTERRRSGASRRRAMPSGLPSTRRSRFC